MLIKRLVDFNVSLDIDGESVEILDILEGQRARQADIAPGWMQVNTDAGSHVLPENLLDCESMTFKTNGHTYAIAIAKA